MERRGSRYPPQRSARVRQNDVMPVRWANSWWDYRLSRNPRRLGRRGAISAICSKQCEDRLRLLALPSHRSCCSMNLIVSATGCSHGWVEPRLQGAVVNGLLGVPRPKRRARRRCRDRHDKQWQSNRPRLPAAGPTGTDYRHPVADADARKPSWSFIFATNTPETSINSAVPQRAGPARISKNSPGTRAVSRDRPKGRR